MQELLTTLYDQGVRAIKMTWSCGGDDGSIEDVELLPNDRHPTDNQINELREVAWRVYEDDYGGYTAGEFHTDGHVFISLKPNGEYKATSENYYSEDEYDEDSDEYTTVNENSEANENVILR